MYKTNTTAMEGNFSKIGDKYPFLLKLVAGFCVAQGIVLIITSITLGALVNKNMDAIEALNRKTDQILNSDDFIKTNTDRLKATSTADNSSKQLPPSALDDLATFMQDQSLRITELEEDRALDTDLIQKQTTKMARLESDIEKYAGRLARLEIGSNTIQDNVNRLDSVDSKIESAVYSIQDNSNSVTDLGQQILDLDLDTESVFTNRARIDELDLNLKSANDSIQKYNVSLTDFGDRIVDLEFDRIIIQNNSDMMTKLDTTMKSVISAIKIQNNSLADMNRRLVEQEATIHDIKNNSNRISELDLNIREVNSDVLRHNDSIADLDKRTKEFETFAAITQNNSHLISELQSSIRSAFNSDQMHNNTLIDFEKRVTELEFLNVSETTRELAANMRSVKSVHQYYNRTLTDIGIRMDELETNISVPSNSGFGGFDSNITSVVKKHDDTLADLSKRTLVLERNVSAYIDKVNDLESNKGSFDNAIIGMNTLMTNVLSNVNEMKSDNSMIKNNSDRIIELYLELQSVNRTIQDYNATLQDFESRLSLTSVEDEKSAFTVYTTEAGPTEGTIRFTNATTNIGGHYNHSSGNFTCHHPGHYLFVLNIFKDTGHSQAHCNIRKNGVNKMSVYSNTSDVVNIYAASSNSVILHLDEDDVVDIGGCTAFETIYKTWETSFSGFLIQKD